MIYPSLFRLKDTVLKKSTFDTLTVKEKIKKQKANEKTVFFLRLTSCEVG